MSFNRFRSDIELIVADMGGGSRAREAVGEWFDSTLTLMLGRFKEQDAGHYGSPRWYSASDQQLEAAATQAMSVLTRVPDEERTAKAPFMTGKIVVFQTRVMLVTPRLYYIPLISYTDSHKYDSRQQKMVPDFMVSIDRPGQTLSDSRFGTSNATTTHAKTVSGAYKSLRSMAEKQFKVSLENIGE